MPLSMEVGLSPGDFVLDGDPAPIAKKGTEPPPDFRPISLRPNGWMHQDTNWFGGRPQLRGLCVRWRPSPLSRKGQFSAHVYCGQTAAWIKMPLGMQEGLGPGDFVLDGDPAPLPKRRRSPGRSPQFSAHVYCGQTARWIKMALGMEVGVGPGHTVLDEDPGRMSLKCPILC